MRIQVTLPSVCHVTLPSVCHVTLPSVYHVTLPSVYKHNLYSVSTPYDSSQTLSNPSRQSASNLNFPYRSIVGKLLYLANGTRPDIAHAVAKACRYFNTPSESNCNAVKRIIRYLFGSSHLGITLGGIRFAELSCFVDAADGDDVDRERSTTGFIFFLGNSPVSWTSHLQTLPTLSSTISELVALTDASSQNIWFRHVLRELRCPPSGPTIVHEDNLSTITLIKNHSNNVRTRPLNRRRFYVQNEWAEEHNIDLRHINNDRQVADALTKSLSKSKFLFHRESLLGTNPQHSNEKNG